MVRVTVEGVRRNFTTSSVFMYSVTLLDEAGRLLFDVGLERHEALPIVAALHNLTLPRPQTINLMVDTLKRQGAALNEILLEDLSGSPIHLFSATLQWGEQPGSQCDQKLDIRPRDAVGLALLMDSPIFLSDGLAKRIGIHLADGQTPETHMIDRLFKIAQITLSEDFKPRLGYSKTPMRDALVREFKASLLGKAPPFPEEDLEQGKKEYLAFLIR